MRIKRVDDLSGIVPSHWGNKQIEVQSEFETTSECINRLIQSKKYPAGCIVELVSLKEFERRLKHESQES